MYTEADYQEHLLKRAIKVADKLSILAFEHDRQDRDTEDSIQLVFDRLTDALLSLNASDLEDVYKALRLHQQKGG